MSVPALGDVGFADRNVIRPVIRQIALKGAVGDVRASIDALADLMDEHREPLARDGAALIEERIPANPSAIFMPYQARWIEDGSRLKLIEKSRQIGLSWATAYAGVSRTALATARFDQWVSSRDDIQAQLFLEDCKFWAGNLKIAADDLGEQVLDPRDRQTAYVLRFASGRRINSMSSSVGTCEAPRCAAIWPMWSPMAGRVKASPSSTWSPTSLRLSASPKSSAASDGCGDAGR